MLVVRHELIFAVRHVHGSQFYVVDMIAVDQPFQRERVPHDLPFLLGTHLLDDLAQVTAHDSVLRPSVVKHQVVTQTGVVYDDLQPRLVQVAESLDFHRFALWGHDTLRKQCDGITSVESELVVEAYGQSQGQVRLSCLQILESLLLRLQLDDVGNVQLLHHHVDQVDIEAIGLSFVVQERIRPEIPRILIHQRALLCIHLRQVALGCRRQPGWAETDQQDDDPYVSGDEHIVTVSYLLFH